MTEGLLTEQRIEALLSELFEALHEERCAAEQLTIARKDTEFFHAKTLLENPPVGKNAEERAREVAVILAEPEPVKATNRRIEAERCLERAKARVELARTAVGLWEALAYQSAGHASE